MATDIEEISGRDLIRSMFNGPALAGVGATTDAGLSTAKYHILPWDPIDRTEMLHAVSGNPQRAVFFAKDQDADVWTDWSAKELFKYAVMNVENVLGGISFFDQYPAVDERTRTDLLADATVIIFLSLSYNYYHNECRAANKAEYEASQKVPTALMKELLTTERINRAATFIAARMHTKYQTNHVVGGTPMQASMASAAKAFYQVGVGKSTEAIQRAKAVAAVMHWALHPLNETLLIPLVIHNSRIQRSYVHREGPEPQELALDEYFDIRANTPPSSSHHFYVCAAAVRLLEPMGVLNWLPQPSRLEDVKTGFGMIRVYGAALHPAARYWGLDRVTSNQKLVEPLCADLGYAVKKLMPASSLAASPILQKEDALDAGWKAFIGALRAALDEKGGQLIDEATMQHIQKAIAPAHTDSGVIREVAGLLQGAPPDPMEKPVLSAVEAATGPPSASSPAAPPPSQPAASSSGAAGKAGKRRAH